MLYVLIRINTRLPVYNGTPGYVIIPNQSTSANYQPTNMVSQSTPSRSERALRTQVRRKFVTNYSYKNRRQVPTTEEIEKAVHDEMTLCNVFKISRDCEEEIYSMIYDEGMRSASGTDKQRFEDLCARWRIPEESLACRHKIKVMMREVGFRAILMDFRPRSTTYAVASGNTASNSTTMRWRWLYVVSPRTYSMRAPNIPTLSKLSVQS
jgi:hypothetical protein